VSPTLTTFLFEAANFLVIVGVLAWLFFRPVGEALERRRVQLQTQADEAAAKLTEAERMRAQMEQKLADLDRELEQRREQSRVAAEQEAVRLIHDARESARQESESAKRRLAHLEHAQLAQLSRVIAETAGSSIDRLLCQLDQPALDHAITAAVCQQICSLDRNSLDHKSPGGNSLAPVRIESAHPLDDSDRNALLAVLGPAAESAEFHVVEDLGMGLRVSTSRGLVDVSSAGLSTFAQQQLAKRLGDDDGKRVENQSHV
jgi:F0F1-type ATP synthase membrane subunit b/b'